MNAQETAQIVAFQGLEWLAEDRDRIEAFVLQTGIAPRDLARHAAEPEMLAAVLDFLLADDGLVLAFAAHAALSPEGVWRARAALPGGEVPNWT
ncbi:DUF3572 domain-containing protein [Pseudogemmobacter sonorensis]|uniref:DUF3572 domain-containing protein n=1 Tax=Pseudogemmobacter sonorensis TaxID=2989681 RepID=UPI0036792B43